MAIDHRLAPAHHQVEIATKSIIVLGRQHQHPGVRVQFKLVKGLHQMGFDRVIEIVEDVYKRQDMAIQLGFAAAIFAVALFVSKQRQTQKS